MIHNTMTYKGFTAVVSYDARDNLLIGDVICARDVIAFQADNLADLRKEFEISIDGYLDFCKKKGLSPDKPVSGNFTLRLPPELHAAAIHAAKSQGKSLTQWVNEAISHAMA